MSFFQNYFEWLTREKLPIGQLAKNLVDWLTDNLSWLFDAISLFLTGLIDAVLWILQAPPPVAAAGIAAAIAYALRQSASLALFAALALLLIINQGYWIETTETLSLVIVSSMICMAIGVPIGIFSAHHPLIYSAIRPLLDLMQTIPTFVYLIPALLLFGLGMVPGLIATVIFALPAPIRLTELGIASTPESLLEAGRAFGSTEQQLLLKVELPYALPQIMEGLTQAIMLSLSMVVIAALVGAEGLGVPTLRALNTINIAQGFEVGLCIVLIAILLDRLFRIPVRAKR